MPSSFDDPPDFRPDPCQTFHNLDVFLSYINLVSKKVNAAIGQLESFLALAAQQGSFNFQLSDALNIGLEVGYLVESCPDLRTLYDCIRATVNELEFGFDFGGGFRAQAPCITSDIQDLVDVQFSCISPVAEDYEDQTGGGQVGDDIPGQDIVEMSSVTNLRATRQGPDILLEWDDAVNDSPVYYRIELYGITRGTVLDDTQFLLTGLTQGRPTLVRVRAVHQSFQFVSEPTEITVIAYDPTPPCEVDNLQIVSVSMLEAILAWQLGNCSYIKGYNIRWEDNKGLENVHWVGTRTEAILSNFFTEPTAVRVTQVTNWDESAGTSLLVVPDSIALVSAVFDQISYATPPPAISGYIDFEASSGIAPVGVWHQFYLHNGNHGQDIPIATGDTSLQSLTTIRVNFTIPDPGVDPVHNRIFYRIRSGSGGESLVGYEDIPLV